MRFTRPQEGYLFLIKFARATHEIGVNANSSKNSSLLNITFSLKMRN
uniref:Uncharacterized protein n=1 Tax=Anguilla anguilla TaxID=7936 RepID=A0A0E9UYZ2_ANGAN